MFDGKNYYKNHVSMTNKALLATAFIYIQM